MSMCKTEAKSNKIWVGLACLLITFTSGSNWFITRWAIKEFPPNYLLSSRFAGAGVLCAIGLAISRKGQFSKRLVGVHMLAAVVWSFCYVLLFKAAQEELPGGLSAVGFAVSAPVIVILSGVFLAESVKPINILGLLTAFAGVALASSQRFGAAALPGHAVGLVLAAATLYSITQLLMKLGKKHDRFTSLTVLLLSMGVILSVWAIMQPNEQPISKLATTKGILLMLYWVATCLGGFAANLYLARHAPTFVLAALVFSPPTIAVLIDLGWEPAFRPTPATFLGVALTLSSIALPALLSKKKDGDKAQSSGEGQLGTVALGMEKA